MSWVTLARSAASKGMNLDDAWFDGSLLQGYQIIGIGTEFTKVAGAGAQAILLRGSIATGLNVARKLRADFGFGSTTIDVARATQLVAGAVLMSNELTETDDDNAALRIFDCPFAPIVIMNSDPMPCAVCMGYVRGCAAEAGSIGISRTRHAPSGEKDCLYEFKKGAEHGLTKYALTKTIPPTEYLYRLLQTIRANLRDRLVSFVLSKAKPLLSQTASPDGESVDKALSYIIELRTRVLGGLTMNENYNAVSIVSEPMAYRISESAGKFAANLALNGFPPLAPGWKKKYGISKGLPEAEKAAILLMTSSMLGGSVGGGNVEATRCVPLEMIRDMMKQPGMYQLSKFDDPASQNRAVKAGCKMCDSTLRNLVKFTDVEAQQISCMADGASTCKWALK